MANRIRVYEIAKDLGIDSKEVIGALSKMGTPVKNHMAALPDETVEALRKTFAGKKSGAQEPERKSAPTTSQSKAPASRKEAAPSQKQEPTSQKQACPVATEDISSSKTISSRFRTPAYRETSGTSLTASGRGPTAAQANARSAKAAVSGE